MIAPPQTLPEFYATKLHQPLPDLRRGAGHFAVFRPLPRTRQHLVNGLG